MTDTQAVTLTEAEETELFELLPVPLQQACARGDMDLAELLERVTNSRDAELCPRCATHTVSARYRRFGLCATCARDAMNYALQERITEMGAQREAVRLRKVIHRLRDQIEPDRERHAGPGSKDASDYGLLTMPVTDEDRPIVPCEACGRVIRQHADDQVLCVSCEERAAVTRGPESKTRTEEHPKGRSPRVDVRPGRTVVQSVEINHT